MASAEGRHATNLELFLDLVFVFAVTQITGFFAHHVSLGGAAQALLLTWLAWWMWSMFTWLGTTVDLQSDPRTRVMVLTMIPAVLLMASTIPSALTTQSVPFAVGYAAVALWLLAIQGRAARGNGAAWSGFRNYVPLAAVGPVLLLVGAFAPEAARMWLWIGVALVNVGSAIRAGRSGGQWHLDAVHFAERHALFVIICLGEVLVAIGSNVAAAATEAALDAATIAALVVTTAVAGALWWSYFAYVPRVVEHALHEASGSAKGNLARDLCTFGHVPLVLGIIAYAVTAKHLVQHPGGPMEGADRVLLAVSVALFVGGLLGLQWQLARHLSRERILAVVAVAAVAAVGAFLPGLVTMTLVAVILTVMSVAMVRAFSRTEMAQRIAE